jgi:hypothetical protein
MNTVFGLFNLAVAIRRIRPDNDNNQHQEMAQPEAVLTAIDYSLLANFPENIANRTKKVVPAFGTTANLGWVLAAVRSES